MFLRRFGLPLLARMKETTGIVGLEVVPNAREVLISLYGKTLKEIQAVPEDEGYRKAVESFTRHRLKVCEEEDDWENIEKRLGCGQVEELIEEATDELTLIAKMIDSVEVEGYDDTQTRRRTSINLDDDTTALRAQATTPKAPGKACLGQDRAGQGRDRTGKGKHDIWNGYGYNGNNSGDWRTGEQNIGGHVSAGAPPYVLP
ncbi:hypothetical protein GIB67_008297 [Kingdonia uniflora]|uniref:Uncharacterized protein n=1 Tax=Kingdonia uniflora TaxID=39325 RepID=A0A7J7N5H7_9MAGN|nr:hypothetical protein GIB67_008297 [Kingdonia uniflora]